VTLAGWVNRHQQEVIGYLVEENRILHEQLAGRRVRLNDDQRRRLPGRGQRLGRRVLRQVATIATPDTILRWHRRLIAQKWTFMSRRPGCPGIMREVSALIVRMATENPALGLQSDPGSVEEPSPGGEKHRGQGLEEPWDLAGARTARVVADVSASPLGCDRRRRLLHDGSVDKRWPEDLLHAVRVGNRLVAPEIRGLVSPHIRCHERLGGLLRYYHRAA
jgi:hypothetical protein